MCPKNHWSFYKRINQTLPGKSHTKNRIPNRITPGRPSKTAPNFKDLCIVQGELNLNSTQRIYTTFTPTNREMERIFTFLG